MSGLATIGQDDFGAGMIRGVAPDTLPGVGVANAVNGLFNDDSDVYRRGGTRYLTTVLGGAAATADGRILFVWSGYLNQTAKLCAATATKTYSVSLATGALTQINAAGLAGPALGAVVAEKLFLPNLTSWDGGAATAAWVRPAALPATGPLRLASLFGRLVVACGSRIAFSKAGDPSSFAATDFHALPGGVVVMGLAALRDTMLVFTNFGLWAISNLAFDLTDASGNAQQTLQLVTPEVSLWHESGLASWAGRIVAPCIDRCFLVDALNPPVAITDSISALYASQAAAGFRPGGAKVFANHLFLPIVDSGFATQRVLVCRLNRAVRSRQTFYPWSAMTGHAAKMVCADVALVLGAPLLLVGTQDANILDFSKFFDPSAAVASDADASVHEFDVETRDFPTGTGNPNHVRKLRLRYTLEGAAQIQAAYSYGLAAQTYEVLRNTSASYTAVKATYPDYLAVLRGTGNPSGLPPSPDDPTRFWYRLEDQTPQTPGLDPVSWNFPQAARVRFIRARFRCTTPVARLILHHMDFQVRQATHNR